MMINGFRTGADDDENGDAEARRRERIRERHNGCVRHRDGLRFRAADQPAR
jgi:hypothetical protein